MRAITAAILGSGFLLATEAKATDMHCVRPEQPAGTGNSMLTWRIPDDCPLTEGERRTKDSAKANRRVLGREGVGATICIEASVPRTLEHDPFRRKHSLSF